MAVMRSPLKVGAQVGLLKAYRKSKARIWRVAAEMVMATRARRHELNVGRLNRLTKAGDRVLVPGKVLGTGILEHKVYVGALAYSKAAKEKIEAAGGKAYSLQEFIRKYPDGKGVKLLVE